MVEAVVKNAIRILVVDDHPIVRAGLATLLGKEERIEFVGGVEGADELMSFLDAHPVDVVLLDLRMPRVSGLEALPLILAREAAPGVIILSSFDYEEEIFRAAQLGARGYLMKDAPRAQIVEAITTVDAGGRYFPQSIAERLEKRRNRPSLSAREIDVLIMMSKGLTNKEIASALEISQFTVRNHINHILEKLEATDRTEAVSVALQQGILQVES